MTRWGWSLSAVALLLPACASTPKSCRGLPGDRLGGRGAFYNALAVDARSLGQADAITLRCAADAGMPSAQVELARRYEDGIGVSRDVSRAIALYERAAAAVPSTTAIYSPPVTLGGRGQVLLVANPNAGPGSAEAQFRLGRLLTTGVDVPRDIERGRLLIRRAAEQGYAPAVSETEGR